MKKLLISLFPLFFATSLKAQHPKLTTWTKGHEAVISMAIYNSPVLKSSNNKTRRYYCDCYVKGLKETYPKGIANNVPYNVQKRIANKCMKLIKVNALIFKD